MHQNCSLFAVTGLLAASSIAAPTRTVPVEERDFIGSCGSIDEPIESVTSGLAGDATTGTSIFKDILGDLNQIVPTNSPADIEEVQTLVHGIFTPQSSNLYTNIAGLIENSLSPSDLSDVINSYSSGENSQTNWNPKNPAKWIFPKLNGKDAPFSLTEQQLREVIYIPSTFTWGKKPPVILVPGTGATGGENYGANYIKLLTGSSYADPVWLNIPGFMLMDAQVTSEYIAYAINYIKETTGQKPSLIGWSQGNLDIHWALKYWPSTAANAKQHIAISPDYHGTVLASFLCPNFPQLPCPPSVIQQEYNSAYVAALRKNGGDSAYIPTTNVFSTTDEIVQPQAIPSASAMLNDARHVGVTNNELQQVCNGKPAGLFYTHEGVLFNPVAFALAKDALIHGGPGQVSRIDLSNLCQEVATDGLSLTDVVATEGIIAIASAAVLAYQAPVYAEPALMSYATW